MARSYGSPKRTRAQIMSAMEMRLQLCTDDALATITIEEMMRSGFYRAEAEERLRAEREKRGMVDA